MKAYTYLLTLALAFLISTIGFAQNTANFTQFYFNPALLNSSLTGVEGRASMFISYRKQWVGFNGSPSIGNFSLQTALPNRVNLGLNLATDKQGLINTSSALFSGGYTLPLSLTQTIRFGFSLGFASTQVDVNALNYVDAGDQTITNALKSNFQPIGNLGASIHGQTFHFGLSIPNLFQPLVLSTNSFGVPEIKPLDNLVAHASNRFYYQKGKFMFEPYVVYRFNKSLPSQLEVAALMHLNNVLYLGASYKANYGISALAGYRVSKLMALGLSYSLPSGGTSSINSPSLEIQLGILFGKRNTKIPHYSFVDTELEKKHHKTALELANDRRKVKTGLVKTNTLYNAPRYRNQSSDTIGTLKPAPEKKQPVVAKAKTPVTKQVVVETKPVEKKPLPVVEKKVIAVPTEKSTLEEVIAHKQNQLEKGDSTNKRVTKITPTQRVVLDSATQHNEEQDRLKRLDLHAEDPLANHNEEGHPHAERHEFAKRGMHSSEMDLGDYVIAGVFSSEANAKKYSDGLRKLGFKDSDYGFLSAHNHWYVHISESNDINTARTDRDKFRKMTIFKESWLLTVHP